MNEEQVRNMIERCAMSVEEREELMYEGLQIFLTNCFGEYLDEKQLDKLARMLRRFRTRPKDIDYSKELTEVITEDSVISNRFIPRRSVRKDELAVLLYNIGPYALLNRRQTAMLAKDAFPNFFSTVATVNTTFTKYMKVPGSLMERSILLTVPSFPEHTVESVELILLELAKNYSNNINTEEI